MSSNKNALREPTRWGIKCKGTNYVGYQEGSSSATRQILDTSCNCHLLRKLSCYLNKFCTWSCGRIVCLFGLWIPQANLDIVLLWPIPPEHLKQISPLLSQLINKQFQISANRGPVSSIADEMIFWTLISKPKRCKARKLVICLVLEASIKAWT